MFSISHIKRGLTEWGNIGNLFIIMDHYQGDMVNTLPLVGPLQDNGGATPTHALALNSPAIENGDNDLCLLIDQRGVSRPQGLSCDIGAYEFNGDVSIFMVFLLLVVK